MKKVLWLTVSLLMVSALVLTSCQAGTTTTGTTTTGGTTVTGKTTPTATSPATSTATTTTTTTAGAVMVKDAQGRLVEKPQYGGTVTIFKATDYDGWDPTTKQVGDGGTYIGMGMVYEMLGVSDWSTDRSKCDFTSSYVPTAYQKGYSALESYEISDPKTYIIHIRKGIMYQNKPPVNGRELTTTDVKYSIDRLLCLGEFAKENPLPRSYYGTWVNYFDHSEIIDKYTIKFVLNTTWTLLPEYLGAGDYMPWIFPREVLDKYGPNFSWDKVVGWGPFMLTDLVPSSSVTFTKHPNYYGRDEAFPNNQVPYVDRVKVLIISDASTQLAALRTGKVDHSRLMSLSLSDAVMLTKTNPELKYIKFKAVAPCLDLRWDLKPWSDRKVRMAMQMAIDIDAINKSYFQGMGWKTASMVTDAWPEYFTPLKEYPQDVQDAFTYNPTKAKQLLADAGYPNGFTQNIELSTAASQTSRDLSALFIAYWEAIGIKTNIRTREPAAHSGFIYSGNQELVWKNAAGHWMPGEIMGHWYGGQAKTAWNFANFNDPVFNDIKERAGAEPDIAKRTALYKEGFKYGTSQFIYTMGPQLPGFHFWQEWLKNFHGENRVNAWGYGAAVYSRVWIDQALKTKMTGSTK